MIYSLFLCVGSFVGTVGNKLENDKRCANKHQPESRKWEKSCTTKNNGGHLIAFGPSNRISSTRSLCFFN